MGRRTKRIKVGHSSSRLTDLSQLPVTSEGARSIQPFPGDFPTEVWLEVHLCSRHVFSCTKQRGRFWRRLNYGTYSRFTGHQKHCKNYSSGQCASNFGRTPYTTFIISTYLVSRDLRVGIWLCSSYTRLVKYDSNRLTLVMTDAQLVDVRSPRYDTGSPPMGSRCPDMYIMCLQTRNVSVRRT